MVTNCLGGYQIVRDHEHTAGPLFGIRKVVEGSSKYILEKKTR